MIIQTRNVLATKTLRGALEVRKKLEIPFGDPVCVYDLADDLGISVRFYEIDSLGGMFDKKSQQIILPTRRPPGRQAFSCAHELGHWYFQHGTRIDSLEDLDGHCVNEDEEFLAENFAGHLLMTRASVQEAFASRGWSPSTAGALEFYTVAGQLGVGYATLIQHMRYALKTIDSSKTDPLLRVTPKIIRSEYLGLGDAARVVIVDLAWRAVAIDLRVGDIVIFPHDTILEGPRLQKIGEHEQGVIAEAVQQGLGRATQKEAGWAAYTRVSRAHYHGIAKYRHLEDCDDE